MLVSRWQGLVPKICTRTCVCRLGHSTHFYGASSQGRRFSDVPKRSKSGQVLKDTVEICQFEGGVQDTILICYFGRNTFDPRSRHNTVSAAFLLISHSRHSLSTNSHTRAKDYGLPGYTFSWAFYVGMLTILYCLSAYLVRETIIYEIVCHEFDFRRF